MQALMQLGGLVLLVGMTYAPVVGLLGLLNLRDRRQSTLLGTVLGQLPWRELRGRLAIHARCALLSRRGLVRLDMRACSRDEIWEAVGRVSRSLPPSVRLVIDGTVDPQFPAAVTVEATGSPPRCHPPRPSVAPG
jgi:hypothetical protein